MIAKTQKWDTADYQRIESVEYNNDELIVTFADGSTVKLDVAQLLSSDVHTAAWDALSFDPYEIVIPTSTGEVEIPWTTIRLLSDKEFAIYWTSVAENDAKLIGTRIKELRERKKLTSKEVAERAGITPQSLSRIERGHHDVVFTTLRKILAAMGSTLQDLVDVHVAPTSLDRILKHLGAHGIKREWVLNRLLPEELLRKLTQQSDHPDINLLEEVARQISRVFDWPVEKLLQLEPLRVDASLAHAAKFKTQGRTQEIEATAYAAYAHFLSLLVLDATAHFQAQQLPQTAEEVRQAIAMKYRFFNFESFVKYVWDLGIPVVPLQDSGAFHGACWKIAGRNIIVLKQVTPYQSRWLYDLAHEFAHVIRHLSTENPEIIESEEISPFQDSDEESEASEFADDLVLYGRAEELAEMSVEYAKGKIPNLKSAVIQIAAQEHVPVDSLANYMAFRLSEANGINWWGAANNLQIAEPSPMSIARRVFLERVTLEKLNPEDKDLVVRAVRE